MLFILYIWDYISMLSRKNRFAPELLQRSSPEKSMPLNANGPIELGWRLITLDPSIFHPSVGLVYMCVRNKVTYLVDRTLKRWSI